MTDDVKTQSTTDWKTWLFKQGTTTVLLVGITVFMGWYLIVPMRKMQEKMMENAISVNEINSKTNAENARTNATNSLLLARIAEGQLVEARQRELNIELLKQIRDDQRRFPAVSERLSERDKP